jgi:outer membrane receptor for ferrienterochelin and colicin
VGATSVFGGEMEMTWRPDPVAVDLSYSATVATDLNSGNTQYAFPQHMAHFRVGWQPVTDVWLNVRGDIYGKRPRTAWTTESLLPDGDPFSLIHLNMAMSPKGHKNTSIEGTIFNVLDSDYKTMIFLDDINALNSDGSPKYPEDIEGEERSLYVAITQKF